MNTKITQIFKDALSSFQKDNNNRPYISFLSMVWLYFSVPGIIGFSLVFIGLSVTPSITSYLITGVSIFAGLFFNLLIVVADKYNLRKKELADNDNDEIKNYLTRYHNFSKQLISQVSLAILLSILLIMLLFTANFHLLNESYSFKNMEISSDFLIQARDVVIFTLGIQFIGLLILILSKMYQMLLEDLEFKP